MQGCAQVDGIVGSSDPETDLGNQGVLGPMGLVAGGPGIMRNKTRHAMVGAFPLLLPHAPKPTLPLPHPAHRCTHGHHHGREVL